MRELGTDLVSLVVQSLELAVRAEQLVEVLGARVWVPIPGARDELPGVITWAGQAVAVLDLARFRAGLVPLSPGESRARLALVRSPAGHLALPVDRISAVWRTHDDNLRPRELHDFELARREVQLEGRVLPVFDSELLLTRLGWESAA